MDAPDVVIPARQRIAATPASRLRAGVARALTRRCPYCAGTRDLFVSWFSVRDRCPWCGTLFAYETGYFLGSYVINLVFTEFLAVAIVVSLIAWSSLTVLQMQIAAVVLAVGLPLLFYPTAVLLWIALDIAIHPPDPRTGRHPT